MEADKIFVCAAGNEGVEYHEGKSSKIYRREMGNFIKTNPDLEKNIVIVGAWDEEEKKVAKFSNRPGLLGVQDNFYFAPGVNIESDLMPGPNGEKRTGKKSGTSMAAPYIAGILTKLFYLYPSDLSTQEAVEILKQSATTSDEVAQGDINAMQAMKKDKSPLTKQEKEQYLPLLYGNGVIIADTVFKNAAQYVAEKKARIEKENRENPSHYFNAASFRVEDAGPEGSLFLKENSVFQDSELESFVIL